MNLKDIGFYTLSDERVRNSSDHSQMKRCEMIITEYCNFKCPYCSGLSEQIYGSRRIKQLSTKEIYTNIDYWCEGIPLENIRFSGGEPTLHKDICDIISYTKSKGVNRIAISTNGSNKLELYKKLISLGVNDISISLDACCSDIGDKMAGNIPGAFDIVVNTIKECSKLTYVTAGIVLNPDNIQSMIDTIYFADSLGVSDIRIISSSHWNQPLVGLEIIDDALLDRHPILKYRVNNFKNNIPIRGILPADPNRCGLVLDDSVIAGDYHFPCVIYMRQKGMPIGKVGPNMREQRKHWFLNHNTHEDLICKNNCLDVCVSYCRKFKQYHPEYF